MPRCTVLKGTVCISVPSVLGTVHAIYRLNVNQKTLWHILLYCTGHEIVLRDITSETSTLRLYTLTGRRWPIGGILRRWRKLAKAGGRWGGKEDGGRWLTGQVLHEPESTDVNRGPLFGSIGKVLPG